MLYILLLLFSLKLCAATTDADVKSPEEIQQELNAAEAEFEYAKTLFYPYYTGPLLTPSASMVPPGQALEQPYIYCVDNYAAFNEDRKSVSLPSSLVQLQIQPLIVLTGVTDSVDTTVIFSQIMNWQQGQFGGGINDLSTQVGFLIARQQVRTPAFKFTISQNFPTGKYQNLSTNGLGLNATGSGAYKTSFGVATSKILFWDTHHPLNARGFVGYSISAPVHVTNFNAYGGGFGTRGVVHPGNRLTADIGLELSITQRWVIATDVAYTATNRTKFNGKAGVTATGAPASVGGGYSDNLSIAPAFEYNWNDRGGLIAGVWFSVYGRNSLNFVQGVVSAFFTFP